MWIIMKKTYSGPLGSFFAGQKYDLPESTVKQLKKTTAKRKGYYKETCAPWDEGKDVKAIEQAQLVSKAKGAQIWAGLLADKIGEAKLKVEGLVSIVDAKQTEAQKAEQAAKEAIAKADKAAEHAKEHPSENSEAKATKLKAIAHQLDSDSERKDLEFQKAHGELQMVSAESGLKQLEADDAKRQAKELAEQAGIEFEEQTKDDAVAEGQAVSAL